MGCSFLIMVDYMHDDRVARSYVLMTSVPLRAV
ncbi:hypothetical protein W823_25270 [Williamsia sp. D3]|nr:hypothetical protein W823_25270 [Williamsia sp. D3]